MFKKFDEFILESKLDDKKEYIRKNPDGNAILDEVEINCPELSLDEFKKAMKASLDRAHDNFVKWDNPRQAISREKAMKEQLYINKEKLRMAKMYSESKWKTEKKRTFYIAGKLARMDDPEKQANMIYGKEPIDGFIKNNVGFKIDVIPGSMSSFGEIGLNRFDERVEDIYNRLRENKYWMHAEGWFLDVYGRFSGTLSLILPDEYQKMFDKERENLNKSVSDFYSGSTYRGD